MKVARFAALAAALLCAGCLASTTRPAAVPPAASAPAAASAPTAVPSAAVPAAKAAPISSGMRWFGYAAERRAIYLETYRTAAAAVERAAAGRAAGSWGVVLDIDETILDNSPWEREHERTGAPVEPSFGDWCRRAEARPLPGAKEFLARVRALGGRIDLVSNRDDEVCEATRRNLDAVGLPYDQILCRVGTSDKNPRFAAVREGRAPSTLPAHEVVAYVGDNIQDFPGLEQAAAAAAGEDAYAPFGTAWFALPNPMYGSWEKTAPK
ncbi:5'-nucleotidase, lipoprotein e(P4) family [bacterium]|nr:5'-nucleotidase, lipoprotein e(P4) family [bacterium]